MSDLHQNITKAVSEVQDPELRRSLGELRMIRDVSIAHDHVQVEVALTIVGCPASDRIEREVRAAISSVTELPSVVNLGVMTPEERSELIARVRSESGGGSMQFTADSLTRVIAVTSGKGGVGKSTLTANLAIAFAQEGLAVGVIDADVHGYSIPGLLGMGDVSPTRIDSMIVPPEAHGVRVISIGMFTDGTPVAWRGPMLHRTVQQFLTDVHFGAIDVLLIDLPPGTGDIAISIGQLLPHADVIVVTTPQPAAAEVAVRSGQLARSVGQNVVGVIENMSGFVGPDGTVTQLFGQGGGQDVANRLSQGQDSPVPLLGTVPLSVPLREGGDSGTPVILGDSSDPAATAILEIARKVLTTGKTRTRTPLPIRPE